MPKARMRTLLEFRLDLDCRTISTWTSRSDRRNCDTIVTFQYISVNMHSFWGQVKLSNSCTKRKKQEKDVGTKLLDWYWLKLEIYLQTISVPIQQIIKASNYIHIYTYLIVFVYNWKLLDSAELVAVVWTNTRKQPGKAKKRQLRPSDHTADQQLCIIFARLASCGDFPCLGRTKRSFVGRRSDFGYHSSHHHIIPPNPLVNRLLWVAFFSAARRSPSPCRHISDS